MEQKPLQDTGERALLVAVDLGEYDVESSLIELKELVQSAGGEPVRTIVQKRDAIKAATCVGSGMVQEIARICQVDDLTLLVFDRELTPTQIRNLEEETGVHTIDRTMLILDIFARRAVTKEGKLQVELAQLQYLLPRLTGMGAALSRQGGGIGARGPGETKLETDRRHIRRRITAVKEQLLEVENHRALLQNRRKKDGVTTIALVGYTNAGKSTLMNTLTNAGVLAENKLFATLDPTARALQLPSGKEVLLIDTVGLVRHLPHHLVQAFRSTLEVAVQADLLLNVCDASSDEALLHLEVTRELLESLGCTDTPILNVLNKWDLVEPYRQFPLEHSVKICAKSGEGVPLLLEKAEEMLPQKEVKCHLLFPFDKGSLAAKVRQEGVLLEENYTEFGLEMTALVPQEMVHLVVEYVLHDE